MFFVAFHSRIVTVSYIVWMLTFFCRCGLCDYAGSQKEHVLRHMRCKHKEELGITSENVKVTSQKSKSTRENVSIKTEAQEDGAGDVLTSEVKVQEIEVPGVSERSADDVGDDALAETPGVDVDTTTPSTPHPIVVDQSGTCTCVRDARDHTSRGDVSSVF